jgi:hypothetical protein
MIKNERIDSLLVAQNIQKIDALTLIMLDDQDITATRYQHAYILTLEIIEDMAMHGVPREFFAKDLKAIQLDASLAHHVANRNYEAIKAWNDEAEEGTILRII